MIIEIKPLIENFQLPVYSSNGAAAFDVFSPTELTLIKNETSTLALGFAAAVPFGYVALLVTRSGNGANKGIILRNQVGVIDSDYRGEWKVKLCLDNFQDQENVNAFEYTIKPKDRIVQCLVVPVTQVSFQVTDELRETERNTGGFGSTGR